MGQAGPDTRLGMNGTPCTKKPYTSVKSARERTQNVGNRTRVYHCESCGAYHVTNRDYGKHHEPEMPLELLRPAHKGRHRRKPRPPKPQ